MKRHESIGHLQRQTGAKVPVPRHSEIDSRLAVKICRQLGIRPIR